MKVAIVHDYLSQMGGAERVVLCLAEMFPDAPIFTSIYPRDRTFREFKGKDIQTSRLQGRVNPERFRSAFFRYPSAFRSFDLSQFDKVVISSSAFAHHVRHPHSLVYCHSPARFLYDPSAYAGGIKRRVLASPAFGSLRRADRQAALHHQSYAANSETTAQRVKHVYGREAPVIYPPLWTGHLPAPLTPIPSAPHALVVSRLLPYKRVDLAVDACALAGVPLTVVGQGPAEAQLKERANWDVTFLGRVPDEQLAQLFEEASVVLVPGREDFGYLPVEANYAGRPVIAFGGAGALETVVDGVTGRLVRSMDPVAWAQALREVHDRTWSPAALRQATEKFGAEAFRVAVTEWVSAAA